MAQPLPTDKEPMVDSLGRVRPVWYRFFSGAPTEDEVAAEVTTAVAALSTNQDGVEAGTALDKFVSPGLMQYHQSAAKAWCSFNSAGTTAGAYNITSITDTGTGNLTANIATDFSSANWTPAMAPGVGAFATLFAYVASKGAGTLQFLSNNSAGSAQDITTYNFAGYGDQ
jgi:hypothetical protein